MVFFCFPFCSSFPVYTSIASIGVDGFALCPDPFSFVLSFFSLFLALLQADPAVVGLGICLINK